MSAVDDVWQHLGDVCAGGDIWARLTVECATRADHHQHEPPPEAPPAPRCACCGAWCTACTALPAGWAELPADLRDHLDVGDAVQLGHALAELELPPNLRRPRPRRVERVERVEASTMEDAGRRRTGPVLRVVGPHDTR